MTDQSMPDQQMPDQWSPHPEPVGPAPAGTEEAGTEEAGTEAAPSRPDDAGAARDELAVLDELEADLVAVEQAVDSLERVSSEGLDGAEAAERIAAAVSVERFAAD